MNNRKYVLGDDGQPKLQADLETWARWYEQADRHIANEQLENGLRVSTVFLGLDHNFFGDGPPILWETMIFGAPEDSELDGYQERYATREEAETGHRRVVELASKATFS